MKRKLSLLMAVCLLLTAFALPVSAAPLTLGELGYKFYPLRDTVFVNFHNPYFNPVNNIIVNMIIREGTGRNRVVAIGQTRLPEHLVLLPGEATSARVPIRARVLRDVPPLAQFEFRIYGAQIDRDEVPPEVIVQDSSNGITMELNRDANNVPFVMGFVALNPTLTEETTARVDMAILTFLDSDGQIVWSEIMPVGGNLKTNDSLLLWGKYDQAGVYGVGDIATVEAKFVISDGN